jgi:hypothetical protein
MRHLRGFCPGIACAVISAHAQLPPDTLQAWNNYVHESEVRALTIAQQGSLLPNDTPAWREQLHDGRIVIFNTTIHSIHRPPHATLQDWTGAIFIRGATLEQVDAVVTGYDRYAERYGPVIRSSQLLDRTADTQRFRLRYVHKAIFEVMAYEIEYESHDSRISDRHSYSTTRSLAVHQIGNLGKPDEYQMPEDHPDAFIWRAESFLQFDEMDGGVYLAQESIVLGHPVPLFWRWLVDPFIDRLARDLVTSWLRQTRDAIRIDPTGSQESRISPMPPARIDTIH